MGSSKREETVEKNFPASKDGPGPIYKGKQDKFYDFKPLELLLLIFSLYSLETWKKYIFLIPAHTVP